MRDLYYSFALDDDGRVIQVIVNPDTLEVRATGKVYRNEDEAVRDILRSTYISDTCTQKRHTV